MQRDTAQSSVHIAFVLGVIVGAAIVGLITYRTVQSEHRYAAAAIAAAQASNARAPVDYMRAEDMLGRAMRYGRTSAERVKRADDEVKRLTEQLNRRKAEDARSR